MRHATGLITLGALVVALCWSSPARAQWDVPISDPEPLNTNAGFDSGWDSGPQVTTDGVGNWVVVWWSEDSLGGTIGIDVDILVSQSTDNGATWTDPEPLNANADSDSRYDYGPHVTTDGAGNWVAVWYSSDDLGGTIGTDLDILVSLSVDNGLTWSGSAPLNTNAATDSDGDQDPQVTTDAASKSQAFLGHTLPDTTAFHMPTKGHVGDSALWRQSSPPAR